MGMLDLLLNEMTTLSILDLVTRIYELDTHVIEDVMVLHKSSGMHFLTAPPRPELAEKVEGEHINIILDLMRRIFDYIVINTSVYHQRALPGGAWKVQTRSFSSPRRRSPTFVTSMLF